jgi:hypothetical protein
MFSQHFKDDFQRKFFVLASEEKNMKYMPRLKKDEIGVTVCPSVYLSSSTKPEETERDIRRKVSYSTVLRPKFLSAFNKRFFRCIYLLLIYIDFSCEVWCQSSGETSQVTDPEIDQEHPDMMDMEVCI